jgi:hypothetical protein
MKPLGIILLAIGFALGIFGFSMDTTVESGGQTIGSGQYSVRVPITRVHNIGLMEDRRLLLYGAGLSLLLGAIFTGFGTLAKATVKGAAAPDAKADLSEVLIQKFIKSTDITEQELTQLAELAGKKASVARLSNHTNGNTLLHLAALKGLAVPAEQLIAAGASRSARNGNGRCPYQLTDEESLLKLLREDA